MLLVFSRVLGDMFFELCHLFLQVLRDLLVNIFKHGFHWRLGPTLSLLDCIQHSNSFLVFHCPGLLVCQLLVALQKSVKAAQGIHTVGELVHLARRSVARGVVAGAVVALAIGHAEKKEQ